MSKDLVLPEEIECPCHMHVLKRLEIAQGYVSTSYLQTTHNTTHSGRMQVHTTLKDINLESQCVISNYRASLGNDKAARNLSG